MGDCRQTNGNAYPTPHLETIQMLKTNFLRVCRSTTLPPTSLTGNIYPLWNSTQSEVKDKSLREAPQARCLCLFIFCFPSSVFSLSCVHPSVHLYRVLVKESFDRSVRIKHSEASGKQGDKRATEETSAGEEGKVLYLAWSPHQTQVGYRPADLSCLQRQKAQVKGSGGWSGRSGKWENWQQSGWMMHWLRNYHTHTEHRQTSCKEGLMGE